VIRRIVLARLSLTILLLLATGIVVGCSGGQGSDTNSVSIHSKAGKSVKLRVEIADDEAEREKGLSGRTQLAADAGMLFLLDDRHAGFWMLNTLIPLSAAFISRCGEIVAIVEMQPNSLEIHNTPRDYRFGLEANAGWYAKNGIAAGDKVEIPKSLRQPGCS
jgi:uncharacterized membrane protein (UPF0127 family)